MTRLDEFPTFLNGRIDFSKLKRTHALVSQMANIRNAPITKVPKDPVFHKLLLESVDDP